MSFHTSCSCPAMPVLAALALAVTFTAHSAAPPPPVVSPEVAADRQITFRIRAPQAETVQLSSSGDIPGIGFGQARPLTQGDDGVWEVTVGPLAPGAYRYSFNVDGVSVVDPRNPRTSESNETTWSFVQVPGADWLDTQDVPRGAVAQITYWSSTLQRFRRLHVYTPAFKEASKKGDRRRPSECSSTALAKSW